MGNRIQELASQVQRLPAPESYFAGRCQTQLSLVDNLILFTRRTRTELQEQTFESRPHHRFVLVFPLQTAGMVSIDGSVFSLPEKSGMLIFPYQFHQWIEVEQEDILWLFITFEHPDPDQLLPLRNVRFQLRAEHSKELEELVERYHRPSNVLIDNKLVLRTTLFLTQIQETATQNQSVDQSLPPAHNGKGKTLLERIEQELHNNHPDHLPRAPELAARVGLSESRLRTIFKQHVGISLGSYLRNYQVHRAIALMKNPTASVTEIATHAGFSSAGSFSRTFKAHTGATPSEFREKMPGK